MAFSTRITTLHGNLLSLHIDQIGLPIANSDTRLREFYEGGYLDYYGVFSWEEVWELNEKAINEDK
jgi:hypothetical protein